MISELEEDTTGVPGPDGGFDLTLAERWRIGGGRLNGGYHLAVLADTGLRTDALVIGRVVFRVPTAREHFRWL
ncbi:MAG TPA: hypothetical protein VGH76_24790 [Actinomycetospora sp.]|uniref:hypothetical protein n=1 Tax=Actinomycetospora sp. TaxID=1872135 RepID=UPI002F3FCEE3